MYEFRNWSKPQEIGITDENIICEWDERVAICTLDGGLDEQAARHVAWQQVFPELDHVPAVIEGATL